MASGWGVSHVVQILAISWIWLGSFRLPFSRKLSGLRYLHGSHYGGDAITDLRRLFASRLIPTRITRDCCQIEPLIRLNEVYRDFEFPSRKASQDGFAPCHNLVRQRGGTILRLRRNPGELLCPAHTRWLGRTGSLHPLRSEWSP